MEKNQPDDCRNASCFGRTATDHQDSRPAHLTKICVDSPEAPWHELKRKPNDAASEHFSEYNKVLRARQFMMRTMKNINRLGVLRKRQDQIYTNEIEHVEI